MLLTQKEMRRNLRLQLVCIQNICSSECLLGGDNDEILTAWTHLRESAIQGAADCRRLVGCGSL
jgi:hypothetical protein